MTSAAGFTTDPDTPAALAERLRAIPVFATLTAEDLLWLAERMQVVRFQPGDIVGLEETPANRMMVLLEGNVSARKEQGRADGRTYTATAGQVTGMLPYSRLKSFPLTSRAMTPTTAAFLDTALFPEMLAHIPALGPILVGVMSDRIRETTRSDQQREKMLALGKLAAGFAHELNNPVSAVHSSSIALREAVQNLRTAQLRLDSKDLSHEDRLLIARTECDWAKTKPPLTGVIELSDREETLGAWLSAHGVGNPWSVAASLVESGCDIEMLRSLADRFDSETLVAVLMRLSAWSTIQQLTQQIETGSSRISGLIAAIKDYSFMDQAPEQEVDVNDGLDSTLTMLNYRFTPQVTIHRDYDTRIPRVSGNGSELNQVWTNLIDNALDAMSGGGSLGLKTVSEYGRVLVEVCDSGPGIPPEIRDRIFEPFFTTKPLGEGIGLGLDIVYRIVRKHRGEVQVESHPGRTSFQVRIPAATAVAPAF